MTRLAAGALLVAAAGCAGMPSAEAEEVPVRGGAGHCDASKAQALIGLKASRELGEEAVRLTGATALRWIPAGGVVTMDYRENRLNLRLDPRNVVVKIDCG